MNFTILAFATEFIRKFTVIEIKGEFGNFVILNHFHDFIIIFFGGAILINLADKSKTGNKDK